MLELTHTLAYIGADEERAKQWRDWSNPQRTYPGAIFDTIRTTSETVFKSDAEAAKREYETIYRQICQIKHGNTLAMEVPNAAVVADYQCVVIGPLVSEEFRRLGHAAAQWAVRYAILAETAFIRLHVNPDTWDDLFAQQTRFSDRQRDLVQASARTFK